MNGLTDAEREALAVGLATSGGCWDYEACCYTALDSLLPVVEQIIAARVTEALNKAADVIESRIARNIGGHPFADHDRGLREAARIVRAATPKPLAERGPLSCQ